MQAAAREEEPVQLAQGTVALLPNECLLRGGFLKEHLIFPRVSQVAGKGFIPLWKIDPLLNRFLTPGSVNGRPLAECSVFVTLLEARNAAQAAAVAPAQPVADDGDDPVAALGLDKRCWRKRKRKVDDEVAPAPAPPPFVIIAVAAVARAGPWELFVATASHRGACPAIEATAQNNLQRLFEEAQHQLALPAGEREQQQPRREAQGPPNNRIVKGKNGPKQVWRKRARTNEKLARPYSYRYKVSTRPAEVNENAGEPQGDNDNLDGDPYA